MVRSRNYNNLLSCLQPLQTMERPRRSRMVDISKDKKWGLKQEKIAIKKFKEKMGAKWNEFAPLGMYSHFDYCAHAKKTRKCCFVEIKSRRNNHDAYDETIVPAIKIRKALALINAGHKAYLVVNFLDGIYYLDMEKASLRFDWNARRDRGALELGLYAFLGISQFKKIKGGTK